MAHKRVLCFAALIALVASAIGAAAVTPLVAIQGEVSATTSTLTDLAHWLAIARLQRPILGGQKFARTPLTKDAAQIARKLLWEDHVTFVRQTRAAEWSDEAIAIGSNTLRFKKRQFGDKPSNGWNLFISLHGGGSATAEVNDQQWQNQIQLYQPRNSLYIAPRAPTDHWNLWQEAHVDELLDRLIEDAIVLGDVDPNHIYLMGYSAGGDGVYQLAPRMADRWAAAAMMAGHPNDASPFNLRNVPFAIHVGALDTGYDTNQSAEKWGNLLDDLRKLDPAGYVHVVQLHPGRGHWMNLEDRVAVDWMEQFRREPTPDRIVWRQASIVHDRFYWLSAPIEQLESGQVVVATRNQQRINIQKAEGLHGLAVWLSDSMLNLDEPIVVMLEGDEIFRGRAPRTILALEQSLAIRGDPDLMFDARIDLHWPEDESARP